MKHISWNWVLQSRSLSGLKHMPDGNQVENMTGHTSFAPDLHASSTIDPKINLP